MAQKFLAILDTMWGRSGRAPQWFRINPRNHSGARLYKLTGASEGDLWVCNACPQQVGHPRAHGTPSVTWLWDCFARLDDRWLDLPLLVCGKVAQATYSKMLAEGAVAHRGPVLQMPHPAARSWTKNSLTQYQRKIAKLTISRR